MATVLCLPQWQGSGHRDAQRLVAGARRTAELIPADARITVPVLDTEDREITDGARALNVLLENLRLTREALDGIDDLVITAGGDCGVDLAPVTTALSRHGDGLTVLWLDAHTDLYTPETLPSGAFHGMVLRTLLGEGPAPLVPDRLLAPEQVILAGVRWGEPSHFDYLEQNGIRRYDVGNLEDMLEVLDGPVYIHIDLDVIDPTEFGSICYPEPDGVPAERLIGLVSRIDTIVGAAMTEHAPSGDNPGEAEIIRRLGAALAHG
jgi:arginase